MVMNNGEIKGVVHGKTIELERDAGLPEGQEVRVMLRPMLIPGEGLRRSFGAWAEDAEELDEFLRQVYRERDSADRPELPQ